ncbi:MAG: DNA-directed RNA polymerase subunit alpha [Parcubacteria group bacterium]|jgi:DNA-directed RNA polymerase subunit alpha
MLEVTLPKNPTYVALNDNTGKIEIDGCYPGYGTTLANSLRRVLLSSLKGSAVTAIKIKGVTHEFSTVPGVLEDVIQIILNLKKVRFKSHQDGPIRLTLKEIGVKTITAAQIQCPADVEVVNKDAHIAKITDKKGELDMEIEIQKGLGYVPVEQQLREKKEIGLIAIDAIYTPIKRVNYSIENTRVGKRTDYDKITLEVETDGSMSPQEAFTEAVGTVIAQYKALAEFNDEKLEEPAAKEVAVQPDENMLGANEAEPKQDAKSIGTETLSFSTRTMNVLEKNEIKTIGDLIKFTEEELNGLEGMGEKGIKEIKKAVGNFGLTLK